MFYHLQNLLWGFMSRGLLSCHHHAGSRIHKISSTLSKIIGDGGGGGGGDSASDLYSVKLCVMINFSLRHNVLCFSFVVVLHSMYSLYAIIKVVLLNESNCHV